MPLKSDPEKEKWMDIQSELDVEKKNLNYQKKKIFPFNPNFISDYKGYKLGMSVAEIDRLHAFRRKNSYVNSAEEFQKVTLVSDSLLNELAPYFKFPSWVIKRTTQTRGSYKQAYSKQQHLFVQQDINLATKEDLIAVYAKVNNSTGIVNLAMLGAKNYSVNVNGKTTTVSSSNFSTVLTNGLNTISVTTDTDCQGIYQQEIFISEKAFIYPNPTFGVLNIFVGGTEEKIAMNLNNLSGATIKKMNLTVGETREVEVDLSSIPQGTYIININSTTVSQSFKVIKL